MSQSIIQTAFSAGEWAPQLNARVDLAKYHAACSLALNWFVDYRGGLSTRVGTKYILQAYKSATAVRLISFQASTSVGYVMEFGDGYIRFYNNGAAILEASKAITAATKANPAVVTSNSHGYAIGDWIFIQSVVGMTQLNNRYFVITATTTNTFTLGKILDGSNVNSSAYTTYSSGGTVSRVYTLPSPYAAADLATLKFAQNVSFMVICHPSYVPYKLTLITSNNWTIAPVSFGATIGIPASPAWATNGTGGSWHYLYKVSAVDVNGQEGQPSVEFGGVSQNLYDGTAPLSITLTWTAVSGAQSYNIYKTNPVFNITISGKGLAMGFCQNVLATTCYDTTYLPYTPDFSQTPELGQNPFQGAGVDHATVGTAGAYTVFPTITFADPPAGGYTATGSVVLSGTGTPTIAVSNTGHTVGQIISAPNGVALVVATIDGSGNILTFRPFTWPGSSPGSITSGSPPSNPISTGVGGITFNMTWGVSAINMTYAGAGYTSVPAITFSSGAAAATAVLSTASAGNPSVPIFYNQRLWLMGPPGAPQQFNASVPGAYYNFNTTVPALADNAIQGTLVSTELHTIKAAIQSPGGLIILSDKAAWLVNGGQSGVAPSAINLDANTQAYNGSSDLQPIVVNFDILYVQAKGSIVRDLSYNFYTNIFTGTDISILSSHLFFGYTMTSWAYAEEPFKLVWVVRSDGVMLSLTYVKEQEMIGWCHHDTNGLWKSNAVVTETVSGSLVDAHYLVAQRTINGTTVQYIERMAERIFPSASYTVPWCVDAGLQYSGAPATSFTGGDHLAGVACVGLADGLPVSFTMGSDGTFTLGTAASLVTVGLQYTPKFKTLALDTGQPTVQGKDKKVVNGTIRVADTLGLKIGTTFNNLVLMKDLQLGQVGGMSNEVVTTLVTSDARTYIDPKVNPFGQYCIQQDYPYPASILGVIPDIVIGDTQ